MKLNNVVDITAELILKEAKEIYGIEESIDTLMNYYSYVQIKKENEISMGSYNILIRNKSEYNSYTKLIEIIYKILKNNNVIKGTYKYLNKDDIRKMTSRALKEEIKEDLIIIDTKNMNCSIDYILTDIKNIMEEYRDKVFIIVDEDRCEGLINAKLGEMLIWTMNINPISKENKIDYINRKLKENGINNNLQYISELSEEPFWKVKRELLYAIVITKKNNSNEISNDFINKKNNEEQENKKDKKHNKPINELNSMIGIEEVKKQIEQIVNYIKVAKQRGKMPMLHMCFLGNPGTGKTTVARIIGKIFSEMKLLSENEKFVEAQRNDLIGEYVGQTAPKTMRTINKANGGVLFIDEAYSIASYIQDEAGRDYGAECIATLLKEMEDKRDSLCVIMAGYTKEMEHMLKVNPGFESRIQFKINFPDYNEDELYEILKQMVKDEKYRLSSNVKEIVIDFFRQEKSKENFDNARFVRNFFEKIKFEQADRVIKNKENVNMIKKCDIERAILKQEKKVEKQKKIGFESVG